MTLIRFEDHEGQISAEVDAPAGEQVLTIAQNAGQPLEGTCEGQMACSTCHVLVMQVEGEPPPPPSEEEEDMLDFAYGATNRSRLSCQLMTTETLKKLVLRMPGGSVDMSR